ncbi:MAG TPA: imelysin family protein [Azospirillum sp.]|nr:imelysin family protein [Azospirillum sp.]
MRRRMFLALVPAVAVALLVPGEPAQARTAEQDKDLLAGLVRTHVEKRTGALATATSDLAARVERFCAGPDAAGLEGVRAGYGAAMDAWAGVQHLRPGPLLLEMRSDRIAFWPERRNIVTRQVEQLLGARDPKALEPAAFAKQSAAVQGLTAVERLLFGDGVTAASFGGAGGGETGGHRCALTLAVARNVARLGTEVRDGWAVLGPQLVAGATTPVGASAKEAVDNLYASLVTALQVVVDQKLLIPLGESLADAKPALAESARAGRSLKNIEINLAAMRAMVLGEDGGPGFAALLPDNAEGTAARKAVAKAFDDAAAAVKAVPVSLDKAVADPKQRKTVEAAFRAAKSVQTVLVQKFPPLIGVTLGFNELDGD